MFVESGTILPSRFGMVTMKYGLDGSNGVGAPNWTSSRRTLWRDSIIPSSRIFYPPCWGNSPPAFSTGKLPLLCRRQALPRLGRVTSTSGGYGQVLHRSKSTRRTLGVSTQSMGCSQCRATPPFYSSRVPPTVPSIATSFDCMSGIQRVTSTCRCTLRSMWAQLLT